MALGVYVCELLVEVENVASMSDLRVLVILSEDAVVASASFTSHIDCVVHVVHFNLQHLRWFLAFGTVDCWES